MFKFYLDNNLVDDAVNWNEFTETIERDEVVKGLLPKYDIKLNFIGAGYEYLLNQFKENGFCSIVEIKVEQSCGDDNFKEIFIGNIFLSDCKFNLNKCFVECSVEDNNFGARIRNNKSIKTALDSKLSKNGVVIDQCDYIDVTMFEPSINTALPHTRKMYLLGDAFRYLVTWMSDGLVGYESNYVDNLETAICSGYELRNYVGVSPIISFDDLFKEVDKIEHIGFTIVNRNGKPTIKIENADYFYGNSSGLQLNNIQDLQQSIDNELLYSNFKIGSNTAAFDPLIHSFIPRQFIGFNEEEYFLKGVCNIDKTLDLVNNWILDSNIIEELIVTNTTNKSYDKDVFIIKVVQPLGVWSGCPYTQIGSSAKYYNGDYTNERRAARYNFAGDIALYSGLDNTGFWAHVTNRNDTIFGNLPDRDFQQADTGALSPPSPQISAEVQAKFNDDSTPPNYNTGGNYNSGTWTYTVPTNAAGNFFFYTNISFKIFRPSPSLTLGINRKWRVNVIIYQYDVSNVLVATFTETFPSLSTYYNYGEGVYNFSNGKNIVCNVGDYVAVFVSIESEPINYLFDSEIRAMIDNTSEFKTFAETSGGGVYQTNDTGVYKASKLEFIRPLSQSDYDNFKTDLSRSIVVNHDGTTNKTGWVRKIVRNISTGETNFELISDIDNI